MQCLTFGVLAESGPSDPHRGGQTGRPEAAHRRDEYGTQLLKTEVMSIKGTHQACIAQGDDARPNAPTVFLSKESCLRTLSQNGAASWQKEGPAVGPKLDPVQASRRHDEPRQRTGATTVECQLLGDISGRRVGGLSPTREVACSTPSLVGIHGNRHDDKLDDLVSGLHGWSMEPEPRSDLCGTHDSVLSVVFLRILFWATR
jgi:hypothetical protein